MGDSSSAESADEGEGAVSGGIVVGRGEELGERVVLSHRREGEFEGCLGGLAEGERFVEGDREGRGDGVGDPALHADREADGRRDVVGDRGGVAGVDDDEPELVGEGAEESEEARLWEEVRAVGARLKEEGAVGVAVTAQVKHLGLMLKEGSAEVVEACGGELD